MYKVFLVEDEIVTREGIRDKVDWRAAGFEFCGEAPDGEMALPLIEAAQPDLLITDIRMPFMDGLQLCKIVRERMPGTRVIILSGHDEFNYAQAAVKLGVSEYLLKPVSAQDLQKTLQKIALLLDEERREQEDLKQLRDQAERNRALIREKFLLRLAMGGEASPAAIEQSQELGLDIIGRAYLVVLIRIELEEKGQPFDYQACQQVERLVAGLLENNPDAFLTKKGMEELVLIIKGDSPARLEQEAYFLTELIQHGVEGKAACRLTVGCGSPQQRLGDIHHSFAEAMVRVKGGGETLSGSLDKAELLKLDKTALEDYLKFGRLEDFAPFFEAYLQPLGGAAQRSSIVRNYIFVDIVLTTARFVSDLGGNIDRIVPEINTLETILLSIKTPLQIRAETQRIFTSVLTFRDAQTHSQQRVALIHQARAYIDHHYARPDLSLNDVAAQVNLSPNHFSTVFSHETGETFKDYLTRVRLDRAKELLRTTSLKSFEVAEQCGYNDPHYFSHIFRKHTGQTPQQFRAGRPAY